MLVAQETSVTIIKVQLSAISRVSCGWSHHVAVVVLPWYVNVCVLWSQGQIAKKCEITIISASSISLLIGRKPLLASEVCHFIEVSCYKWNLVLQSIPSHGICPEPLHICVCISLSVSCSLLYECVMALSAFSSVVSFLTFLFLSSYLRHLLSL